ncbi:hypothetical protein TNCV_3360281 [Trichonephila clavipes]|nr:hypothetical protein TNCV_3360281 [Trichonephila clavipes]
MTPLQSKKTDNTFIPTVSYILDLLLLSCVSSWDTYERRETETHIQYNHRFYYTNDDPSIEQKECAAFLSRQESITGESPTSFPEDKGCFFIDNLVTLHFKYDQARRRFVEWAQNEIAVVPDFHKRVLFSDETHFWLNGYVNKQNCHIWSEANPQVYVETPLHPEKLTVWCALWAGGILLQKR